MTVHFDIEEPQELPLYEDRMRYDAQIFWCYWCDGTGIAGGSDLLCKSCAGIGADI